MVYCCFENSLLSISDFLILSLHLYQLFSPGYLNEILCPIFLWNVINISAYSRKYLDAGLMLMAIVKIGYLYEKRRYSFRMVCRP